MKLTASSIWKLLAAAMRSHQPRCIGHHGANGHRAWHGHGTGNKGKGHPTQTKTEP